MLPHHLLAVFAPPPPRLWLAAKQTFHFDTFQCQTSDMEVHGQKSRPHMVHIRLHRLSRFQYATCEQEGFHGEVELCANAMNTWNGSDSKE